MLTRLEKCRVLRVRYAKSCQFIGSREVFVTLPTIDYAKVNFGLNFLSNLCGVRNVGIDGRDSERFPDTAIF